MLLALLVAVVAVAFGVGIGLARSSAHRTLGPVRTFALVAAFATVVFELLPRAVAKGGLVALATFAGAAALPWVVERLGAKVASERSAALRLEIGYVGLLIHHVGDGLGLGTFAGGSHSGHAHWEVLVAIGGHTIPVTAVVVLAYGRRASRRVAALRGGLFAVAIALGIVLTRSVPASAFAGVEAYVTAAVAGLLLHVATHDWLEDPPTTGGARALDLLAAAVGVGLVVIGGAAHEHEHVRGAPDLDDVPGVALHLAFRYAPALLAAVVLGALLERSAPPRPPRSPFLAAVLGATAGGRPERGMALIDGRAGTERATAVAFAMGSAGIALETLAVLSTAFGPPFAGVWVALSAFAIGVTAIAARRLPASSSAPAAHDHGAHDHGGHDHGDHDHGDHDHGDHDYGDHDHGDHDHGDAGRDVGRAASTKPTDAGAPARARTLRDGIDEGIGRVGGPALLGIAIAAVLQLGLRDASLVKLSRLHLDLAVLPLLPILVSLPPLAWAAPLLVLVDKGAYAPAALVAIAIAAANRPSVVAWARLSIGARATGWLAATAVGGVLVYLRWPPSPARILVHESDPVGAVCAAILGGLMLAGLARRGVRPWLALGVGTTSHDHGPCFEESARVTPIPPPPAG